MPHRKIKKSLVLEVEPVLHWPAAPASIRRFEGCVLKDVGSGLTYYLQPKQSHFVEMVGWDGSRISDWRDVFGDRKMVPIGLTRLAKLSENLSYQNICKWVTENGPLGFQPSDNPVYSGGPFIPQYSGTTPIPLLEPLECIRSAARRAANVVDLWSALKNSYTIEGRESTRVIQSVVTFIQSEPLQPAEDMPVHYPTRVNGEPRGFWPIPRNSREWRKLANTILAGYIQNHLAGNVGLVAGVHKQSKDQEDETRELDTHPDWNLKPTWHVGSALAGCYLELLMVMRRFRSCKTCGGDISHQRDESRYCSKSSSCRSKQWHRNAAARKLAR